MNPDVWIGVIIGWIIVVAIYYRKSENRKRRIMADLAKKHFENKDEE